MVATLVFDHFGRLGLTGRHLGLPQLIGVALLVGVVVLIEWRRRSMVLH